MSKLAMNLLKKHWLLIVILGLALSVRLWGIDYGLPYFLVNDERPLVYAALKMGELKTLIPSLHPEEFDIMNYRYNFLMSYVYLIFLIPLVLLYYLFGSFASFSELTNYFIFNPEPIWLLARVVNVLIGVATIFLVYLAGKKMVNRSVGLLSAAFLAFSFLHVQLSHFTRPWVPMTLLAALTMLLALRIWRQPKTKHYLLTGLVLGLAYGINSGAIVIIFIFLLAHFMPHGVSALWRKMKDKNLWFFFIVFIAVAAFFAAINPNNSSNMLLAAQSLFSGKSGLGLWQAFYFHIRGLFFYEPLVLLFSLAGLTILYAKSKKLFFIGLSWPVFYIAFLYFINCINCVEFPEELMMSRFLLVLLPWLSILAGFAVYRLTAILSRNFKMLAVVLIFALPAAVAFQYSRLLSVGDNRAAGLAWVEQNIPDGAKIMSSWGGLNPVPTKEAIILQKTIDAASLRVTDEALLRMPDESYPHPVYSIIKLAYIDRDKWIIPDDYQYYLAAFWQESDLTPKERALIGRGRLLKEFKQNQAEEVLEINGDFSRFIFALFFIERPGPIVRIYELQ